jgi:hypothetical protein
VGSRNISFHLHGRENRTIDEKSTTGGRSTSTDSSSPMAVALITLIADIAVSYARVCTHNILLRGSAVGIVAFVNILVVQFKRRLPSDGCLCLAIRCVRAGLSISRGATACTRASSGSSAEWNPNGDTLLTGGRAADAAIHTDPTTTTTTTTTTTVTLPQPAPYRCCRNTSWSLVHTSSFIHCTGRNSCSIQAVLLFYPIETAVFICIFAIKLRNLARVG